MVQFFDFHVSEVARSIEPDKKINMNPLLWPLVLQLVFDIYHSSQRNLHRQSVMQGYQQFPKIS